MTQKKKISLWKTTVVGFIWTLIYFYVGAFLFRKLFFNFNVLHLADWGTLYRAFQDEIFVVDTWRDSLFLISLFAFFPLWLIGWYYARFITISLPRPKPKRPKNITLPKKEAFKPKQLRVQSGVAYTLPMNEQKVIKQDAPLSETGNPIHEDQITQLEQFTAAFKADVFKHIKLGGQLIDLSIATDEKALLIEFVTTPDMSWAFDDEQNTEEAAWFSQGGQIDSPIYKLSTIATALSEANPDSEIIKAVVLTNGSFADVEESQKIALDNGALLLQFNNPDSPELPTIQSVIEQNFEKKESA